MEMGTSWPLKAVGLAIWLARATSSEPIPTPTGKFNVGIQRHVVNFVNPGDPSSPSNVSTEYLATLYYPTLDEPAPATPYLEPELAQMYADVWDFDIGHLTSTIRWNASFLPPTDSPAGPTLLFGPGGWGPPTDGYTIVLSELASRGYVVAALDHPGEQPFVRYPNGTGVTGLALDFPADLEFVLALYETRVREMSHFANNWPALVDELCAPFAKRNLGVFGHSLGGAAAMTAALEGGDVFAAAANVDGQNGGAFATPESADLGMPALLFGAEGHDASADPTWAVFGDAQSDWWRWLTVDGTLHLDFSDATFWKQWGSTRPMGVIEAQRMVDLTNEVILGFFDKSLLGKEAPILDGQLEEWPEVKYEDGAGAA